MLRTISRVSVSVFALVGLVSSTASAEPKASIAAPAVNASLGDPADPAAPACVPSCRSGYTCVQGACVSACNPGCAAGEQCTSDGQCVAKAAPTQTQTALAPQPAPAPVAVAPATATDATDVDTAPASTKRGVHTHDGFYMRLAVGPAYLNATWKGGTQDVSVTGMGPGLELAFGGTPAPGLVIGGASYGAYVSTPTLSYAGSSADIGATSVTVIGPFVDWYPNPHGGFHMLASPGIAYTSYGSKSGSMTIEGTGFGFTAAAGYDLWVGEQWSLGAQLRLQWTNPSIKASDGSTSSIDTSTVVPALLIGATYH